MRFFLCLLLMLGLTSCQSREEKNGLMAKGCEAAAQGLMANSEDQIDSISAQTFSNSTYGSGYKSVELKANLMRDGYLEDENIECIFYENEGPFGIGYSAEFIHISFDGNDIGKDVDGNIKGGINDFMSITDSVGKATR